MVMQGIDDYLAGKRYPLDVVTHMGMDDLLSKALPLDNSGS